MSRLSFCSRGQSDISDLDQFAINFEYEALKRFFARLLMISADFFGNSTQILTDAASRYICPEVKS